MFNHSQVVQNGVGFNVTFGCGNGNGGGVLLVCSLYCFVFIFIHVFNKKKRKLNTFLCQLKINNIQSPTPNNFKL